MLVRTEISTYVHLVTKTLIPIHMFEENSEVALAAAVSIADKRQTHQPSAV